MNELLRICISLVPGLRFNERLLVEECITDIETFLRIGKADIEDLIYRKLKIKREYPQHGEIYSEAVRIKQDLKLSGAYSVGYWDSAYPPQLRESLDPPYLLYIRGALPSFDLPMVAIVGTRKPSLAARGAAFSLAVEFGCIGIPVVSGLAFGIDASAHWGAVKTGRITLAVLGTGIDRIYPGAHTGLAHRILENGGALVSEKPPGGRIGKYDFPRRNRIISALSRGIVIVQAPERSGALITAEWAAEDNRNVYVHTAGMTGSRGAGTRKLRAEGALCIEHAGEILGDWGIEKNAPCIVRMNTAEQKPAELLRQEMDEEILRFQGMYYRRVG